MRSAPRRCTAPRPSGLDGQVGALKAGMAADLMILDLNEPAFVPFNSAARQIVFAEAGRAVETVLVAGRPVVRDGKLVTVDEAALAAEPPKLSPGLAPRSRRRSRRAAPTSFRRCSKAIARPGRSSPGLNATSAEKNVSSG